MADLIRTVESDLFGAYEWAAQFYEDFADVPEAPDRLAAYRGMLRAYEALEGKADEAMRAAEGLVAAEEELDETEKAAVASLAEARDALFEDADAATAQRFVADFDAAWSAPAQKQALLADAVLAALAHSNVIASLGRATLPPDEVKRHHRRAAELYEEISAMVGFRIGTGSLGWRETWQSALFRASTAWRLAGEEARARRATEMAGPPPS